MICKNCGSPLEDGAMFCGECGTKVELVSQEPDSTQEQELTQTVSTDSLGVESNSVSGTAVANNKTSGINKKIIVICVAAVAVVAIVAVCLTLTKSGGIKNETPLVEPSNYADESNIGIVGQQGVVMYMPVCTGWSCDEVENYFNQRNCFVRYEYEYDSTIPVDCVISQSIEGGTEIEPNTKIIFVISKGESSNPEKYGQKIVVSGSADSSYAYMELFIWENGEWKSQYRCNATVGRNGIGNNYGEGKGVTPAGEFKLGVLLSEYKTSNDSWPHKLVTEDTCVVDDVNSEYYNTIVNIDSLPNYVSYDPIGDTIINDNTDKCMYIEHNGNGLDSYDVVPGKGSAITICGKTSDLYATAGCIDISSRDFNAMLSLLDYNLLPHIIIEVE